MRTSTQTKPFRIKYPITPFTIETVIRHMEGFAEDITLPIENSIQGAQNVIQVIEEFGHI